MANEKLKREFNRMMVGVVVSFGGILSFGWLYCLLYQPRPQDNILILALLAAVATIFAVCMLIFSLHLAMSVSAITILAESIAVLLAISGSPGLSRFVHPYGVVFGALATVLIAAKALSSK